MKLVVATLLGTLLLGFGLGYHIKELEVHDKLLVCAIIVDKLNGTAEE